MENEAIEKILYMGVGRSGLENESSIIAKALSELMEYRAIGTVEEVKNAYGRGYNQGGIDRAEELQKCRKYGYNKAIDDVFDFLKTKRDKRYMKICLDDLEIRKYKEQLKAGAEV